MFVVCIYTLQVIRAEVKVATMLVQHNVPIALADEMTPLFQDVFSDSEIAKRYASRHVKTACLINGALAPHYQQELVVYMKENPFALAIDGSSDNSIEMMNPLTVRIFDQGSSTVCTRFLDMCMSSEANAEAIFSKMEAALAKPGISWENCIGISLDNTTVNMSCRNSIKTRVQHANAAIYIMGCPCHIVPNIAGKANSAFAKVAIASYVYEFISNTQCQDVKVQCGRDND